MYALVSTMYPLVSAMYPLKQTQSQSNVSACIRIFMQILLYIEFFHIILKFFYRLNIKKVVRSVRI